MLIKTARSHDKFYLKENRKLKPKEYFKFIVNNLKFSLNNKSAIDIGCATGDFLYYLQTCYPKASLYGADVDDECQDIITQILALGSQF